MTLCVIPVGRGRSDRFPDVSNLSKTPTYFISANGLFRCEDLMLEQIIMRDKTDCKICLQLQLWKHRDYLYTHGQNRSRSHLKVCIFLGVLKGMIKTNIEQMALNSV